LNREGAYKLLMEAAEINPGRWVEHSKKVAEIAERLAEKLNVDKDKAYIFGLLHDIGRREGVTGTRHILDGYNYLQSVGYTEASRYCLTHSYFVKNVKYIYGKYDMNETETEFVQNYLDNVEYDIYDKLVQIGDCMGLPNGVTLIERRILDVNLRYGVIESTMDIWKAVFGLQDEIEKLLGHSIYKVFPEIGKNISKDLVKEVLTF